MKKILCAVGVLLLFLSACGGAPSGPLVLSGTTGTAAEDGADAPAPTDVPRAAETLPFFAAQRTVFADGTVYSVEGGILTYTPVDTGETRPLCFDPFCTHQNFLECPARIGAESGVIAADGAVTYVARAVKNAAAMPVEYAYQLRVMDVASGEVKVLYEQEDVIDDFWLLGGEAYVSVPYSKETTTDATGTHVSYGGMNVARIGNFGGLTVVLEDPDGMYPTLLASDNGAVYYTGRYGGTPIFAADYGFQTSAAVFETERSAYTYEIWDDCLYYVRMTDVRVDAPNDETVEGDFDPEVSLMMSRGATVCELVRRRIGESEAEVLCGAIPLPGRELVRMKRLYHIDRESGVLYYVPLEFSYQGCVIWEFSEEQKQAADPAWRLGAKPVLTKKYSLTGGRLVRLDLGTMERRDVLAGCGADIADLIAVEAGRVWAQFEVFDAEEIKAEMAAGRKFDTRLTYTYVGAKELLP